MTSSSPLQVVQAPVETLLDLRDRALSPGHPNRPVIWPYDSFEYARHFGGYLDGELVCCVSVDRAALDGSDELSSYRFHSMGVEPARQRTGLGATLLTTLICRLYEEGASLLWATARESAIGFYRRFGMRVADTEEIVPETGFPVRYVMLDRSEMELVLASNAAQSGSEAFSAPLGL